MGFIDPTDYEDSSPEARREFEDQIQRHGRITNMKRSLLRSIPTFKAYMEWYTLRDLVEPFIGARGAVLFSYAISYGNHCLICSLFFRKILVDWGEDPDHPKLSDDEALLMDLGAAIARDAHHVPEEIYTALAARYTQEERVILLGFAGLMVATNLFNTVGRIPLDEVLQGYQSPEFKGAQHEWGV